MSTCLVMICSNVNTRSPDEQMRFTAMPIQTTYTCVMQQNDNLPSILLDFMGCALRIKTTSPNNNNENTQQNRNTNIQYSVMIMFWTLIVHTASVLHKSHTSHPKLIQDVRARNACWSSICVSLFAVHLRFKLLI